MRRTSGISLVGIGLDIERALRTRHFHALVFFIFVIGFLIPWFRGDWA